jgi:hypothetical protein
MYDGSSTYAWHGNSFSDCSMMNADAPIKPVPFYKFGVSQAAAMRGTGVI